MSVDGFVADRDGGIDWTDPDDELFRVHLDEVRTLGVHLLGRRLYEAMLVWENDAALRATSELFTEFADVWTALPKVVFSSSLDHVQGNARLATGLLADEIAAALAGTDKDVAIGGPTLAAQAIELDLVDEFHLFRVPIIVGGGLPYLPAVARSLTLDLVETRTFASQVVYESYRKRPRLTDGLRP